MPLAVLPSPQAADIAIELIWPTAADAKPITLNYWSGPRYSNGW